MALWYIIIIYIISGVPPFGSSGGTGYPSDYPTGFSPYGGRSMFTDVPPTPGSGSVTLPGSIENSKFSHLSSL